MQQERGVQGKTLCNHQPQFYAVGRSENLGGRGGHCVLKWGFTRTFSGNQDVTVKLKSELIYEDPKSICLTQTIPSMCEP
jgi:hypothetical protein